MIISYKLKLSPHSPDQSLSPQPLTPPPLLPPVVSIIPVLINATPPFFHAKTGTFAGLSLVSKSLFRII